MDLRNQVSKTVRFLLVPEITHLGVSVASPSQDNGFMFVVRIELTYHQKKLQSLGANKNFYMAIIKAITEIGEGIIGTDLGVPTRSGIAGGILRKNIEERAKSELIERDAFLYHYRGRVPFGFLEKREIQRGEHQYSFSVYKMASASSKYFSCFVSPGIEESDGHPYIHFGSATGKNFSHETIIQKAIEEYFSLNIFSGKNKSRTLEMGLNPKKQVSEVDKHLAAAFDPRNIAIFTQIMQTAELSLRSASQEIDKHWSLENLHSPIRGFKFCRAENHSLTPLVFGENESTQIGAPLYHPFW